MSREPLSKALKSEPLGHTTGGAGFCVKDPAGAEERPVTTASPSGARARAERGQISAAVTVTISRRPAGAVGPPARGSTEASPSALPLEPLG
ncbi:hypothetical protein AAFF_G00393520 [Aldrovandia affinis]|uniref:Uncharacterized protein n=1 Tax=Aldrovandia affinis TaxID=143900 RepID=A0AAD7SDP7_9TELE|nr:hypothetical protein AAFF_G00393520 [Aldrovandia affinis]